MSTNDATNTSSGAIHWPVPLRRAVVRKRTSYADLVQAWIDELDRNQATLCRWYDGLDRAGCATAIGRLRTWHGRFFASDDAGEEVARDEPNTLDSPPAFFVRLWKGALRVLLEPARFADDGKPMATTPDVLQVVPAKKGAALRLEQSANGEVRNADADFAMGDLVEFPLFVFLRAAGLSNYAGLSFDGDGSPFLGSSVAGANGEGEPVLHDNMMAMRFQLLLGLGRGAFSAEGKPVYKNGKPQQLRPHAFGDGAKVWARGMMYAGTLAYKPKSDRATIENYHWGAERDATAVPECVTNKSGIDNLSTEHPVTPGWTCSPATLLLTNYMLLIDKKRGGNSVRKTMTKSDYDGSTVRSYYVDTTPEKILEDEQPQIDQMRTRIETIVKEIEEILPLLGGEQSIAALAIDQAAKDTAWATDVPESVRKLLARRRKSPQSVYDTIRGRLARRRTSDEEAAQLEPLRLDLIERGVVVRERITTLVATEGWKAVPIKPNSIKLKGRLPVRSELEREEARDSRRVPRMKFNENVAKALGDKRKALKKAGDGPLGGLDAIAVDITDYCSDFSIVSLDGHEWALVKLRPAENLLDAREIPRAGFIAAYDPLSCEPAFIGEGERERGQLTVFEATGGLRRWTHSGTTYNTYGAKPFKWVPLDGNRVAIGPRKKGGMFIRQKARFRKKEGSTQRDETAGTGSWKKFCHIWRCNEAGLDRLASEYGTRGAGDWTPFVIIPTKKGKDEAVKAATRRIEKNWEVYYKERAIPFPTIDECEGGFVTHAEMTQAMRNMIDLSEPSFDGSEKCQFLWQSLTGKERPDPPPDAGADEICEIDDGPAQECVLPESVAP